MAEETVVTETQTDIDNDYLEQIKKLKQNTVSKADYEKLKAEHSRLLGEFVDGTYTPATEDDEETPRTVFDIKEELFNTPNITDTKFVELTLELRDRVLEEEGVDIFVSPSHEYTPTSADYEKASNVADILKQSLEYSNGNDSKLVAELSTHLIEPIIPPARRR